MSIPAVNGYLYTRGDPINMIDPLGLDAISIGLAAAGATGGIAIIIGMAAEPFYYS
jgi:hypothetical protein